MNVIFGLVAVFYSMVLANGKDKMISRIYMDSPGYCSVKRELNEVKERETVFVYGGRNNDHPYTSEHDTCELQFEADTTYAGSARIKVTVRHASFDNDSLGYLEVLQFQHQYKTSTLKYTIDRHTTWLPDIFVSVNEKVTLILFRGCKKPSCSSKYFFTVKITVDVKGAQTAGNIVGIAAIAIVGTGVLLLTCFCVACLIWRLKIKKIQKEYNDTRDKVVKNAEIQRQSMQQNESKPDDSHEKSVTILGVTKPFKIPRPTLLDDTELQE